MEKTDCLIVGCGLCGSVIARHMADQGKHVVIWDRRNHIGGNMHDYIDNHGILVQQYGPHIFHTKKKSLYEYICRFEQWSPYKLICGAAWDNVYTPTPFNFTTIDKFYSPKEASRLKKKIELFFSSRSTAPVVELMQHYDNDIRKFAEFLFVNDYAPYTAKQWGVSADEIDPSVLKRVPIRFSYEEGYFDDLYEVMPQHSYTTFFKNILDHPNIEVILETEALEHLKILSDSIYLDGNKIEYPVVYTGALDELFDCRYGKLPYRSLKFEWHYEEIESFQEAPVVAYPQENGYTRITEYKKLPYQKVQGTSYALEYPIPYVEGENNEPYYPVLIKESEKQYAQYRALADSVPNLFSVGRLADFKYYNMDQALERALEICEIM